MLQATPGRLDHQRQTPALVAVSCQTTCTTCWYVSRLIAAQAPTALLIDSLVIVEYWGIRCLVGHNMGNQNLVYALASI